MVADTFAGRVHIEWDTTAPVTPHGQLLFFIEYLKEGGLFDPTSVVWSKSAAGSRGNARDTTERAKLWC